MARKKTKIWTEDELIDTFNLERLDTDYPLLQEWLKVETVSLNDYEQELFDYLLLWAKKGADFWNEETIKMNLIAPLLHNFVKFNDIQGRYNAFFDKTISAKVEGIDLHTETDFMLAKGIGNIAKTPYFHFQEYKRSLKTPPDPVAQLIEAFLIAQEKNQNKKPLYGAVIIGRSWQFLVMEAKKYTISSFYDFTQKEDLLDIIAILRKFKHILETELLEQ